MQIQNQSVKQLKCLTRKNYFKTKILMINWNFSMKQNSILPVLTLQTNAQEVIFLRKIRKGFHPNLYFNDQSIERSVPHKHLVLTLDEKLSFNNCINDEINKTLKSDCLLRKLSMLLPRQSLLTIYKSFIRPHLD